MVKSVLFIGGLDATTNEEDLTKYFQIFGQVNKAEIVKNKTTKTSKGFGFVKFKNEKDMVKVLNHYPHVICGRKVDCQRAQDTQNKKKHKAELRDRRVFITFLPADTTNQMIEAHFSKFGALRSAYVIKNPETNKCKGYGFALFEETEDAIKATEQNTQIINGKEVQVARFKSKKQLKYPNKNIKNQQSVISDESLSCKKTSSFLNKQKSKNSKDDALFEKRRNRNTFCFENKKESKLKVSLAISKHQKTQMQKFFYENPLNQKINRRPEEIKDQTHRIVKLRKGVYSYCFDNLNYFFF